MFPIVGFSRLYNLTAVMKFLQIKKIMHNKAGVYMAYLHVFYLNAHTRALGQNRYAIHTSVH